VPAYPGCPGKESTIWMLLNCTNWTPLCDQSFCCFYRFRFAAISLDLIEIKCYCNLYGYLPVYWCRGAGVPPQRTGWQHYVMSASKDELTIVCFGNDTWNITVITIIICEMQCSLCWQSNVDDNLLPVTL